MTSPAPRPTRLTWFSPWMIMGSVCILAGILLVLILKNIRREKEFMEKALLSQANVLIRSLEAGSRTGMAGMGWGKRQIQVLMEETAQQPDVLYVAIVNARGEIMAHSQPEEIGKSMSMVLPTGAEATHGFREGGEKSFDVIRPYQPWVRQRRGGACPWERPEDCTLWPSQGGAGGLYIMVGLDPTPFEEAGRQDLHQTILLFGIILLVGAAGFVSLVWAQHYRSARRSLQDVEALTSTIVNQMPVGLLVTDREGRAQKLNQTAEAILKTSGAGSGAAQASRCFAPILHRLKNEETILEEEIQCRLDQANVVPMLVNATVIHDGAQKPAGYAILFSDLTGMKQLEEQLRRNERLASLGRLAAGVAHEIRNPLSSIKGFATILASRSGGDERSMRISEVMVQEVERINRVVSELLDFARPTELNKGRHLCRELLQRTIQLIEGDARQKSVDVELSVQPEDLHLKVDLDRFSQVLLNLYLNALQAMEGGGSLKVEARQGDDEVLLRVTDTGGGIQPEHVSHVFDPYFTTKPGGVGLGLANVHKLVEAHGGDIQVESGVGKGTSFVIRLPAPGKEESCRAVHQYEESAEERKWLDS